ncbi:uncharacterized protein LOC117585257 [Drosophila guanche]|uniref:HMG box domain-containing protein n=1 Tax=Drosophila guanche TaxID=7266 RepID=A0A3B0JNY4_DROGU|nr:uncharacterized protein LOC117585257 [Drosophila guanche]SPP82613.1 Hypothetical predicted protein [Drosophila guanche]
MPKKLDSDSPMFVACSAHFNFLREYRKACAGHDIQPQQLFHEASTAWQALSTEEKTLFEEENYLPARLAETGKSSVGIAVDLLTSQGKNIFGKAKSKAKRKAVKRQVPAKQKKSQQTTLRPKMRPNNDPVSPCVLQIIFRKLS